MQILDEIQSISNIYGVPMDKLVASYSPQEGICVWFIRSQLESGFKYPEFVMQTLEQDKKGYWWVRKEYDEMDWDSSYIFDEEKVDLGPTPFVKKMKDFLDYYRPLWEMEGKRATEENVNTVGINYEKIKNTAVARKSDHPITVFKNQKPLTFEEFMDPDFPVTFEVNGYKFDNLRDVDKFICYNRMRRILFSGGRFTDDFQMEMMRRIVSNKDDFIKYLKSL